MAPVATRRASPSPRQRRLKRHNPTRDGRAGLCKRIGYLTVPFLQHQAVPVTRSRTENALSKLRNARSPWAQRPIAPPRLILLSEMPPASGDPRRLLAIGRSIVEFASIRDTLMALRDGEAGQC